MAVGGALVYHSSPYLFTWAGHANFVHMLSQVGLPAPAPTAWLVALLEFFGGLGLIVGFLTNIVALLLILEVVSRISVIWLRGRGYPTPLLGQPPLPGYELNLQYVAGLIAVVIAGPGRFSFDRRRAQRAAAGDQSQGYAACKKGVL
jgi:putative oxidoreductase